MFEEALGQRHALGRELIDRGAHVRTELPRRKRCIAGVADVVERRARVIEQRTGDDLSGP